MTQIASMVGSLVVVYLISANYTQLKAAMK